MIKRIILKGTFVLAAVCAASLMSCKVNIELEGGTIVVSNHSDMDFTGTVRIDSEEIFDDTIPARSTKYFYHGSNGRVFIDFESEDGTTVTEDKYLSSATVVYFDL